MSTEITNNSKPAAEKPDWLELPRNIKLQRYVMGDRSLMYMGQYLQEAHKDIRLYRIEARKDNISGGWTTLIYEDNKLLWSGSSQLNRKVTEYVAVKSLKAILLMKIENCARAHRQRAAVAAAKKEG